MMRLTVVLIIIAVLVLLPRLQQPARKSPTKKPPRDQPDAPTDLAIMQWDLERSRRDRARRRGSQR